MVVLTKIEQEVMDCIADGHNLKCSYFDPNNQPSVADRLRQGWDPITWYIHTGMSLNLGEGLGEIAFTSEVTCCMEHEERLIERGGWDGTGERQSEHVGRR
jgi:hypothetical protein